VSGESDLGPAPDSKEVNATLPSTNGVGVPINELPIQTSRPTVRLDPTNLKPTWPVIIASLEQLSDWAVFAFRLGTLALIQACVRELAQTNARADLVVRLRELTEALAHMPLEV
jgi:hypothetical protein